MPNIELHSLGTRAQQFKEAIFKAIGEQAPELLEQAVVTICDDYCTDAENNTQPYMRICCTNMQEIEKLKEIFKPLALDKEILHLTEFIPAG